jgi:hypothetical protein
MSERSMRDILCSQWLKCELVRKIMGPLVAVVV